MRRLVLVPVAVVLAATATLAGPTEADAAPSVFPKGERTAIDRDTTRMWLKPGNLFDGRAVSITIDGQDAVQRRDGVWVADVDAPRRRDRNTVYVSIVTTDEVWGTWMKFRKVRP